MSPLPLAFIGGPLGIVAFSILFIVFVITVLRLHAFFALILAAAVVSLLTATTQTGDGRFVKAVEAVMTEFGSTAGKLGFAIALAAVIGACLMESGAADKIVRRMIAVLGEGRAALAMCLTGFVLAAPVFADTVFMLMLPLARSLARRTGKDYILYVCAMGAGVVVTNGIVPPAPGPMFVADKLGITMGHAILTGIAFGLLPALAGLATARWVNKRWPAPPRPLEGETAESLTAQAAKPESELPGFLPSIAPVVLPLILIAAAATLDAILKHATAATRASVSPTLVQVVQFLGNKNIALLLGALVALAVNARQKAISWKQVGARLGKPVEMAGVMILIVSAGGAFGGMIQNAGIGEQVRALAGGHALNYVLLAWLVTVIIRGAQGSATVATIAGAGVMMSIAGTAGFGVHPLYIFLAIGFGSKGLLWMNDAGFWIVSRMSGLTQGEMLKSWSVVISLISLYGLIEVLVVSALWPQLPF
jgi:GntP family gluconate:H+ symporter